MNSVNGANSVPVYFQKNFDKSEHPVEINAKDEMSEVKLKDEKIDPSLYDKIMQNLALASMMMSNRRSNLTQRNIEQMNMQIQQQNDMMNNMLIHQQAMDAHQQAMQSHMTAVQMTTPGMGFM